MKKLLLASAIAALSVSAQAAPQVYGKAFLSLDLIDGETEAKDATGTAKYKDGGRSQLNSNASRIGFKGSEALTANTDLVYQLEYGVKVDDNSTQFRSRDTFLGLSNKQYGTVLAGRLTAIDGMVDYANVTQGGVIGGDNVLASHDAPRANNAFAYVSPNYNGVNFLGMYAMDENDGNTLTAFGVDSPLVSALDKHFDSDTTDALVDGVGFDGDVWGVGAKYEPTNQPFRAGVTYTQASQKALKAVRVSGAYDLTPALTVGALYQQTKWRADKTLQTKNENAFTLSAEYKVPQTPWTAYGQVDVVDNYLSLKDAERQRLVAGSKYAFNKATTGHVYGAYLKEEYKDSATFKYDGFGIGAGIEYKF